MGRRDATRFAEMMDQYRRPFDRGSAQHEELGPIAAQMRHIGQVAAFDQMGSGRFRHEDDRPRIHLIVTVALAEIDRLDGYSMLTLPPSIEYVVCPTTGRSLFRTLRTASNDNSALASRRRISREWVSNATAGSTRCRSGWMPRLGGDNITPLLTRSHC